MKYGKYLVFLPCKPINTTSMERFKEFIRQMIEIIEHLVMWVKNRRRATHAI
jgi:ribosomal protein L30/L7E